EKVKEYILKMEAYSNSVANGVKVKKPIEPKLKRGKINPKYLTLGPLEMFTLRKSILPSMPISLTDLVIELDMVTRSTRNTGLVPHPEYKDKMLHLMDGNQIAVVEPRAFEKFTMVACAAYVVDAKEFTFKKDATKKGLRIILD